jgi:hypothetical protein
MGFDVYEPMESDIRTDRRGLGITKFFVFVYVGLWLLGYYLLHVACCLISKKGPFPKNGASPVDITGTNTIFKQ